MRNSVVLKSALLLGFATPGLLAAQEAPLTGAYVLQRMHDSYAGKWYKSLTFTQKTTRRRPDGTDNVQTWLESMRYTPESGTRLRIDIGDLADGRGILYTADSSWRVQNGKAANGTADGNQFVPLIEGVYVQPIAKTTAELTRLGFNLNKSYRANYDGQPVWIVGAADANDTLVSRFAIDTVRKVLLHMRIMSGPTAPPIDAKLGNYVKAGNAWLATKVDMTSNGKPVQTEEYSDWKIDLELPNALFDVAQWSTVLHWGKKNP
ncbi:MAG: hypothetical protein ABJB66_15305 [Gemmatimonadaceae bacterium]